MRVNLSELQQREPQPTMYAEVTAQNGAVYINFFTPKDQGNVHQFGVLLDRSYAKSLGLALCDEYLKALKQSMDAMEADA
jgi:hypothetical protein